MNYKIAVLSDIHANYTAFKACFEDMKNNNIDEIIFLGDYVTDYPLPEQTFDLIYQIQKEYPCTFVKGNREEYLLKFNNWKPSSKNGALLYTYQHLRKQDIEFLKQLPLTKKVNIEGTDPILIAHGSPDSCFEGLYPDSKENWFNRFEENILLIGHTHEPLNLIQGSKKIINPGSVGASVNGDIRSQYCILSWDDEWKVEFRYMAYDIKKEQQRILDSKIADIAYYWTGACFKNLETGRNEAYLLVNKANELSDNTLTEEHFKIAANDLGIPKLF